jgi:hypothetical protein
MKIQWGQQSDKTAGSCVVVDEGSCAVISFSDVDATGSGRTDDVDCSPDAPFIGGASWPLLVAL